MITSGRSRATAASPVVPSTAVLTSYSRAEVDLQRAQDGRLVVDDEHARHDPMPSADLSPLATGRVIRTVRPPPGVSAAAI
jgi:hypothetical protein